MEIDCHGITFDVPEILIEKYASDFEGLVGGDHRESVMQLRDSSAEIINLIAENPDLLHNVYNQADFIKSLAIRTALSKHGILFDA